MPRANPDSEEKLDIVYTYEYGLIMLLTLFIYWDPQKKFK